MASDRHAFYDGSRAFEWLADHIGLPLDQTNYLIAQATAFVFAMMFRTVLHPKKASAETRHCIAVFLGLIMGYFCFGRQAIHIAILPTICFAIMKIVDPHVMQRVVLVTALAYLSFIHIQRQIYDYGGYSLDVTGPLMVITQKVTSLAFSIHDGLVRKEEDLTPTQKKQVVRCMPTFLEFYSYIFHFQALMVGPVVLYVDYIDFIHGRTFQKHFLLQNGHVDNNSNSKISFVEPSPTRIAIQKLFFSLVFALIFIYVPPYVPLERVKEKDFLENTSFLSKSLYLIVITTSFRPKFYHAWLLAESIYNASGLGFNGFREDGTAKWDLVSNVDIWNMEFGLNMHEGLQAWNKCTMEWLRMVVYERTPVLKTLLTYIVSALWHGFYPGYYITFLTGAVYTLAGRVIRRTIRPYMLVTQRRKQIYDIVSRVFMRIVFGYLTLPFILLEFWPCIAVLKSLSFYQHIGAIFCIFVLPKVVPRHNPKKSLANGDAHKLNGNVKAANGVIPMSHNMETYKDLMATSGDVKICNHME